MMRVVSIIGALWLACGSPVVAQERFERCGVMVEEQGGGIVMEFIPEFFVTGAVPFRLPEGRENVRAVLCERDVLAFADDDYHVITDAGVPLNIRSGSRVIVLEISGGQFRARVIQGELSSEERAGIGAALNRAQRAVQGEP